MGLFTKISSEVDFSRDKIHTVRGNLTACKQLLRCRRDELKKLYMDAVKNKHVMQYLEHINELRAVNSTKFAASLQKRHYLKATKMLMGAVEIAESQLKHVDGLEDLRRDLNNKKVQLYNRLVEEMNRHIYHTSTAEVLSNFQRNNSARISTNQATPFQREKVRKSADRIEANNKAKKALQEISQNGFVQEDFGELDALDSPNLTNSPPSFSRGRHEPPRSRHQLDLLHWHHRRVFRAAQQNPRVHRNGEGSNAVRVAGDRGEDDALHPRLEGAQGRVRGSVS
jgi:hypothetical protein